jgi:hypothetical protein
MQVTGNSLKNTMKSFSIVDETFDPSISSSYFLSIQITLDGFSFCTLDPVRNKYIQIQHINFVRHLSLYQQVEECFNHIEKLSLPYKKTLVLLPGRLATLVPTPLFDGEDVEKWLSFTHTMPEKHAIKTNKIKMADAYNIFSVNQSLEQLLRKQFPNPLFFHQHTPIIEGNLTTNMSNAQQTTLFINLATEYFDLLAFGNNNLKLCNSFPIKSENDFIYFTLFTYEQLKLNPADTEIILSGIHPYFSKLSVHISKYVRKVKHAGMPHHFQYSHQFREINNQSFYNLLSLPVCV